MTRGLTILVSALVLAACAFFIGVDYGRAHPPHEIEFAVAPPLVGPDPYVGDLSPRPRAQTAPPVTWL